MSSYYNGGYPSYGGAQSFTPPPAHSGYGYSSYPAPAPLPPPMPTYMMNQQSFRADFTNRLNELTVNSRPIIQNLTMFIHEYLRFAETVSQCLETHIRRVHPAAKLPAWYLLDMVCKNIPDPYSRLFSAWIVQVFLESYRDVDQATRSRMEELVLTWRNGSASRKELFGVAAQVSIERGIWGDGASGSTITPNQVLSELDYTLSQRERAVQANPYDNTAQNHIVILTQLRNLVSTGVSQQELKQILTQLRNLVRSAPPPSRPPPPPVSQPSRWSSSQPSAYPDSQPNVPAIPPIPTLAPASAPGTSTIPPANIADILSNLLKSGVMSKAGTPSIAPASSTPPPDPTRDAFRAYKAKLIREEVRLATSDITRRQTSNAYQYLYASLPSQCKQCGIRFKDSAAGKKEVHEHLDMHFRQNRKVNQNAARGHSRSWFVGVEDWVHDVKGKGREDGSRPLNAKAAAVEEAAKRTSELRAQYLVVPQGDETKNIACPICQESFKTEWSDDLEDWVWNNAVKKEDRIYHATCHSEASSNVLAARLRNDLAVTKAESRGSTPESVRSGTGAIQTPPPSSSLTRSPSPDSKAGLKRKIEEDASADHSPPAKKMALST